MPSHFIVALSVSLFFGCASSFSFFGFAIEGTAPEPGKPLMVNLRRESVPVKRQGKVVSFKTSYSGVIAIGSPVPQPFRVVFDTGSGHVVVPGASCESDACLVHQRFNSSASHTAVPLNANGRPVPDGELCDQVDIGFGTGKIKGEFVRDTICLGLPSDSAKGAEERPPSEQMCLEMNMVMAVQMSTQPFKSFNFDGIMGLGLSSLALSDEFSFFNLVAKSGKVQSAHFGVFLTEGDVEGEESELAIGGYNANRFLHPLAWSPVAMADLGYWQVRILAVRIDGQELDICRDGTCRGVVDTGTSHLGIPAPHDREVAARLTVDAGELLDCRLAHTPVLEIELESINITLSAENYMRNLPLRDDVNMGSATGVAVAADANGVAADMASALASSAVKSHCRPRLMPVNLPEPVGPKLFILGEPVLHRYYTVYDWKGLQVGFSLANNQRNTALSDPQIANSEGTQPDEVDRSFLLQRTAPVQALRGSPRLDAVQFMQQSIDMSFRHEDDEDEVLFVQVKVCLSIRSA